MKTWKKIVIVAAVLAAVAIPAALMAQAGAKNSGAPPLQILNLRWLHNDIIRNVEEIRRAKDPYAKRDLVEDIQEIIWEKIEFPMSYKQAELTDSYDLDRFGTTTDYIDAGEAAPEAPEVATAYALLGIAKGYEGYGAAAADNFEKAQKIYNQVMNLSVSLDHNEDNRTLGRWITAARGQWGATNATRVTFYGKRVSQSVVDAINNDNLAIYESRKNPNYTHYVAKRDFVRGLKTYLVTDDVLKEKRPNKFDIYLPPGDYELKTALSSDFTVTFEVKKNYRENNFIIETLAQGVAVYPIPDIRVFEEELRKSTLEQQRDYEDTLMGPDEGGGDVLDDIGEPAADLPAAPEPPLE